MIDQTLISDISDEFQQDRGWIVRLNGEIVEYVRKLEIENPRFGKVTYGYSKSGHDGWSFRDVGGAVTVLFSILKGQLYIGVVKQNRPNQGGMVWNVPRGFVDIGETLRTTAVRELQEESGYKADNEEIVELEGEPSNPNSTFFETPNNGNAITFFAAELSPNELVSAEDGYSVKSSKISDSVELKNERAREMIRELRLVPWFEVARLGDMFSNVAVARLLAYLVENGALSLDLSDDG